MRRSALAKELLTESELYALLHRQGFAHVEEVERCVLEPGGGVSVDGKRPPREDRHHTELLARLDELSRQIKELRPGRGTA